MPSAANKIYSGVMIYFHCNQLLLNYNRCLHGLKQLKPSWKMMIILYSTLGKIKVILDETHLHTDPYKINLE